MQNIIENLRIALADWILPRKYVAMRITSSGIRYVELTRDEWRRL